MTGFALVRRMTVRPIVAVALAAATMPLASPGLAVAATGVTERVSVATDGSQGSFGGSASDVSGDGRYVTFTSVSGNLMSGDTNETLDVFVRDRQSGTTERVSVASDGTQANGMTVHASMSDDGRYVALVSHATNLVAGDTNGWPDVFVHDRQSGTTERVSVASDGTQANAFSSDASISADGRYVAFASSASNLVPVDTNFLPDVFVHDRQSGTTERVSVASDGTPGNLQSSQAVISADGRYVTFNSWASNLVPGDTNAETFAGGQDAFVHDRQTGTTERVSVASDGTQANDSSGWWASISADGRFVAFRSSASNLVPGDTNGREDVFVRDRQTGTTERVSVNSDGTQNMAFADSPSISADGRHVAFVSTPVSRVSGDPYGWGGVFVRDRQTGTTEQVSVAPDGNPANGQSYAAAISADGRVVAFTTEASNLVAGDTNGRGDAFVREPTWAAVDATPPTLTLPDPVTVEATSSAGAVVTYSVSASDDTDPDPEVVCTPPSGSTFALGSTSVTCTATDGSGNTATGSFTVTLADTTAPQLSLPDDQTVNATGPSGATVNFAAGATDVADPNPVMMCEPASGATFAVGSTTVSCVATDASGNTATGSFTVTVKGAAQQLGELDGLVESYGLPLTIEDTLLDKVTNAQRDLARGRTADAVKRLADLIKKVDQLDGKNRLSDAQANQLRTDATRIQDALGF